MGTIVVACAAGAGCGNKTSEGNIIRDNEIIDEPKECPICYNVKNLATLTSCPPFDGTHSFCVKCILRITTAGSKKCPMCSTAITAVNNLPVNIFLENENPLFLKIAQTQ